MDISTVSIASVSVEFRAVAQVTSTGAGPDESPATDPEVEFGPAFGQKPGGENGHGRAAESPAHTARRLLSELGHPGGNFGFIVSHIAQGGAFEDLFADDIPEGEPSQTNDEDGDPAAIPPDDEGEPAVGDTGLEAFAAEIEITSIGALIAFGPFVAQVIAQTQNLEFAGLAPS